MIAQQQDPVVLAQQRSVVSMRCDALHVFYRESAECTVIGSAVWHKNVKHIRTNTWGWKLQEVLTIIAFMLPHWLKIPLWFWWHYHQTFLSLYLRKKDYWNSDVCPFNVADICRQSCTTPGKTQLFWPVVQRWFKGVVLSRTRDDDLE